MFKDNLFNKIEQKTNINKETILGLANKLQNNNMKDEKTLREIIKDISNLTGKEVTKEKEDKIISAIINDKVPKNIDTMF
ncbi:MAG: stage VI sporulation protein F [Bacilli bacterium]|nr:stage VI sporulation protein F [Bacilli bacterium]